MLEVAPKLSTEAVCSMAAFKRDCRGDGDMQVTAERLNNLNQRISVLVDTSLKGGILFANNLKVNNMPETFDVINSKRLIVISGVPRVPDVVHGLAHSGYAKEIAFGQAKLESGNKSLVADEVPIGAVIGIVDESGPKKKIHFLV